MDIFTLLIQEDWAYNFLVNIIKNSKDVGKRK